MSEKGWLRWNVRNNVLRDNPKIDAFLADIIEVCRKHGFSISHEDGHGAFEITQFNEGNARWLADANDDTDPYFWETDGKV